MSKIIKDNTETLWLREGLNEDRFFCEYDFTEEELSINGDTLNNEEAKELAEFILKMIGEKS